MRIKFICEVVLDVPGDPAIIEVEGDLDDELWNLTFAERADVLEYEVLSDES